MSEVKMLDAAAFEAVVNSDKVALIDFWASWCGPCKMMLPVLDKVAAELGDTAVVGKVDVGEAKDIAVKYQVRNLPTFMIFKHGEVVKSFSGVQSQTKLVEAVKAAGEA